VFGLGRGVFREGRAENSCLKLGVGLKGEGSSTLNYRYVGSFGNEIGSRGKWHGFKKDTTQNLC